MFHNPEDEWNNPVDFRIGNTIRLLRIVRGLSQQALAHRLNVTFQQVQKYEKAKTHIAASRLYEIARVLDTPIEAFFDSPETDRSAQGAIRDMVDRYDRLSPQFGYHEFVELNRAFVTIADPAVRLALLNLLEEIAPDSPQKPGTPEEVQQEALRERSAQEAVPSSLSGGGPTAEKRGGERRSQTVSPSLRGHAVRREPEKVVG